MPQRKQIELLGLDFQELTDQIEALGEPGYRARQLYSAIYSQRVLSLESITTLPKSLRDRMREQFTVGAPAIERRFVSVDGTIRYLISFADGQSVETVWMPEGDEGESGDGTEAGDEELEAESRVTVPHATVPHAREANVGDAYPHRATICVSSQVGCAVSCQFCMTALLGLQRNLTAGEIVGQILAVLNDRNIDAERDRINLVFMGMGEPFLNYENFMKAVRLLVEGAGIAESRMTVSTAGIVPRIHDFGREPVRPKLAISLNAPNDDLRAQIMPLNRKWDIKQLLDAVRGLPLRNRERVTFEYVLLRGVNDSDENARELARLVYGIRCKINLIALNPGPDIPFASPEQARVSAFQQILIEAGVPAFVRRPRGRDIFAACGQLKRTTDAIQLSPATFSTSS
jgi:23S rRNA (adenine2503-C2)-methyltransferase